MNPEITTTETRPPFRFECRDEFKGMLASAVEYIENEGLKEFKKESPASGWTELFFWLGRELAIKYRSVENKLRLEIAPQRFSDQEVIEELWGLFCEVTGDHEGYKQPRRIILKIRDLEKKWDIELEKFLCAFSIDYLDLGASTFKIGDVSFSTPDAESVAKFGFDSEWWESHSKSVAKASIAQIEVSAGGADRAREVGSGFAQEALTALKVAVLLGRESRLPTDELLQWRFGGLWSVIQSGEEKSAYWGAHRTFRPLVMDLSEAVESGLKNHNFEDFISPGLPEDIRRRMSLAVHWIARSTAYELDDYKIVDLCTALEIMLLPGYARGLKGHMIALRYNLLGGSMSPPAVLGFYELRSGIVHGSVLQASTQLDTWYLRLLCFEVLDLSLRRAKVLPASSTLEELIGAVETPGGISTFIESCQRGIYSGTGVKEMREFAQRHLKQVEANSINLSPVTTYVGSPPPDTPEGESPLS